MYALRYNLSIAVIVMVKHPSEDIGNETDAYSFIDTSERCNITFAHPNKSHPAYADAIDVSISIGMNIITCDFKNLERRV